jgi:hypothetical protein
MEFRAHEMGGSPCAANLVGIFATFCSLTRIRGFDNLSCLDTWGSLAKPRSTPGFMLTPAPQAKTVLSNEARAYSARLPS